MSDDHLQRFAKKVVELQERQQQRVDEQLMVEVAKDLGMSEAELLKVRDESRAAKERARALRSAGNLDEAIEQLETAWAFNPLDVEVAFLLADGLFTRAQKGGDVRQEEWQRALDLCRRVIEVAPAHGEAPALLNAIRNNDPSKKSTGVPVGLIAAAIVVVGVVVLGLLAWLL
ncbi:MAG: tetratricopeptide repeat protein [Deltaproteobacteria bacterium]|nr:tetratricopeptide repeat protein [Deltaproteobacteria bacterium]